VVLFKHHEVVAGQLHLAGRIPRTNKFLGELVAQSFNVEDSQRVVRDGDDALRTALGAEGRGVIE
jgi:hypothetical protein